MISSINSWSSSVPAIIDAHTNVVMTYNQLRIAIEQVKDTLAKKSQCPLLFLYASNTIDSIVAYLAGLASGHVVCLLDADRAKATLPIVDAYHPPLIVLPAGLFQDELAYYDSEPLLPD